MLTVFISVIRTEFSSWRHGLLEAIGFSNTVSTGGQKFGKIVIFGLFSVKYILRR